LLASRQAILEGRGDDLLPGIKRKGQLQLEQLQTGVLAGFKAQEVQLGHVAVSDPADSLKKLADLLEKLGRVPDTLDAIEQQLKDFDKVI
jgi:hypothetical protein